MTLLEILLVVAIMIVVVSLATPNMIRMLQTQKLHKAAGLMRAEMAGTRIKAMKSGRIYMLRYEVNGPGYMSQPWIMADDAIEANGQGEFAAQEMAKTLPEGVIFVGGESAADARAQAVAAEAGSDTLGLQGDWSQPVLFYPDGTASTARVLLGNARDQIVEVKLRGLTGMTTASDLLTRDEVEQGSTP